MEDDPAPAQTDHCIITGGVVLAIWAGWALTGWWIIPTLYKKQAIPVYPLLLILIAGYGFASVFQWNRSLFLSLGKAGYPVLISTLVGVIELALIFTLVPRYWVPDDGRHSLGLFHRFHRFYHSARPMGSSPPGVDGT